MGLLIHEKYEHHITNISYINDSLLYATLEIEKKRIDVVSVYAPDISKPKIEWEEFYSQLEEIFNTIPRENKVILAGDLNARIGNKVIDGITQRFNDEASNEKGELLLGICSQF